MYDPTVVGPELIALAQTVLDAIPASSRVHAEDVWLQSWDSAELEAHFA